MPEPSTHLEPVVYQLRLVGAWIPNSGERVSVRRGGLECGSAPPEPVDARHASCRDLTALFRSARPTACQEWASQVWSARRRGAVAVRGLPVES